MRLGKRWWTNDPHPTNGNGHDPSKLTFERYIGHAPDAESFPVIGLTEREHTHTFAVSVTTFGRPDKTMEEAARALCVQLNRAFTTWALVTPDGRQVIYDALADDGEHDHHDEVLRIVPLA